MGLDISHIQLTLKPNDIGDFFTIDEWDLDCNVSLKHFSKYITTIDDLNFDKTIAIVENEKQLEKLKKTQWFSETEYLKVFIGKLNDKMQTKLAEFIVAQKLDKLENSQLGCEHDGVKYHTISFGEPHKVQGVYYLDDIGYQNKGMSKLFYDSFKKYMLWGKKGDFDLAYNCVADEWYLDNWGQDAVNDMKKNFKENFVDKYKFGKSLLYVSY
jgi:hypothetical protein